MTEAQRGEIRRYMEERLDGLRHRLEGSDLIPLVCADENELASRVSELNMALALRQRDSGLLGDLTRTLRRITAPDFGICAQCGEDIPLARLKAHPTASLCLDCMREMEEMQRKAKAC